MWSTRVPPPDPRLDDLVELLRGIAKILMAIDSKLQDIQTSLEDR